MKVEFTIRRECSPVWFHQALINMTASGTIYYSDDVAGEYHRVKDFKLLSFRPDENRGNPEDNDGWVRIVGFNPDLYLKSESWYPVAMVETLEVLVERRQLSHVAACIKFGNYKQALADINKMLGREVDDNDNI